MNKALPKEIVTRTRLRNRLLKDRSEENRKKTERSIKNNAIIASHFWENLNRTISEILTRKISMITKHFGKLLSPFYRIK